MVGSRPAPTGTCAAPSGAAAPTPPPAHMVLQLGFRHAPPRLAAFPATPRFVPTICIFSPSLHCRPDHKSSLASALGKSSPRLQRLHSSSLG